MLVLPWHATKSGMSQIYLLRRNECPKSSSESAEAGLFYLLIHPRIRCAPSHSDLHVDLLFQSSFRITVRLPETPVSPCNQILQTLR